MNWLQSVELKVGALVVSVGALIGVMSMQVSDDPSLFGRSKKAWFLMPNASGIIKGTAIKTAGIPVGVIKDVRLQDGQARVDITIKSDVPIYSSANIEIKSQGILGDKTIEINSGSSSDPELPEDGQILVVKDKGSLDNMISSIGDVTSSLKKVTEALSEAVTDDGTRKHILGRIVSNIEKLTGDLSQITSDNKEQIGEIVDQVNSVTKTLDEIINDESDKGFKKTWGSAMARIDRSMQNIQEITDKINNGEGTIGKLVSDESTAEDVQTAIEGISGLVDTANRIQTSFDFHAEYLQSIRASKSHIGIQIQPGLDRYYYIALVDDPTGVVERTETTTEVNGGSATVTDEKKVYRNKTKWTVLYAKNFWDITVRGGLIENTGGFGIDYHMMRRKLLVSFDAFDFTQLNLRASAKYDLFYGLYVLGGYQDMLDRGSRRSSYFGAGLALTNDDLKLLLTRSPF
ncbi:MAG: MlaD family protein [Pseudobdellovibrionaceae bacterium]